MFPVWSRWRGIRFAPHCRAPGDESARAKLRDRQSVMLCSARSYPSYPLHPSFLCSRSPRPSLTDCGRWSARSPRTFITEDMDCRRILPYKRLRSLISIQLVGPASVIIYCASSFSSVSSASSVSVCGQSNSNFSPPNIENINLRTILFESIMHSFELK